VEKNQPSRGSGLFGMVSPNQLLLALLFFAFFTFLVSWKFALILMGSLMFHEFGHAWAMKLFRVPIKGMYFMPPFGLAVVAAEPWKTRKAETVIALMGPAWGLALTAATYGVYLAGGGPLWAGVAGFMAMLNLFNLAPINPLDGGRVAKSICYSISPAAGFIMLTLGFAGAVYLGMYLSPIVFVLVGFMAIAEFNQELRLYRRRKDREAVIASLAEKLGCPADASSVIAALQTEFDRIECGDAQARLAQLNPELLEQANDFGYDPVNLLKIALWGMPAIAVLGTYTKLFGHEPLPAVSGQECDPLSPDGLVRNSPLGNFLLESELPKMTKGQLAVGLVSYLAMAAALFGLMTLTNQVLPLEKVLLLLR
jgi:Zn-dependent protease